MRRMRAGRWVCACGIALTAVLAQEAERRFFPDEPGWAERFAVDVAQAPLHDLDDDATPLPAPEGAARYTVTYKGTIASFDVGRVILDVAVSDEAYSLRYAMEQRGIAKVFSDGEARAHAAGTFDTTSTMRPIDGTYYYNHDYEAEDDQQRVELYRPKGADRLRLWAEPEYWFHEPVPEAVAAGATDPLGALVALGFPEVAPGKSPCERTARVYDGRRRFDLRFEPDGTKDLNAQEGEFGGETHACRMTLTKVAGYRPKDRAEMEGSAWVYLAPVPEAVRTKTFAYVPIEVRAKQGIFRAKLEAKYPVITGPDGTRYPLYEE